MIWWLLKTKMEIHEVLESVRTVEKMTLQNQK
jgi:hypothetical protein